MRLLIDLDGTICELKKTGQTYADVRVNPGASEKLKALKKAGHYIILHTARHMKTCNGDVELVKVKVGQITIDWLAKHKIPYDELHFGKPYAEAYIDDLTFPFTNWGNFNPEILDTSQVNILITMAGVGSRFVKAGFKQPKPLISVKGKAMVEWAMNSFDFLDSHKNKKLIFLALKEHIENYRLDKELKRFFGSQIAIISVPAVTGGQAETALLASPQINNFQKLFIYNCDTYSQSPIWELIQTEDPDGVIPCFESNDPRYSYVRVDKFGYGAEVAEKKVISNLATTGMYYFKRGMDFVSSALALKALGEKQKGEFYIGPCYNELIKAGKKIRTVKAIKNYVLGTPEELEVFKKYKV